MQVAFTGSQFYKRGSGCQLVYSPAPINLRSTRFTNVYLPDPGVCPHTGPMPALMAALWLFIVLSLSVLVYWEYKRALKRRPVRIPFDPFARMS
jgi:hypothetical protein